MCTVVVRWAPGAPVRALALRDELTGRAFDDPDRWWPAQPDVVGGRDRVAGGSWCVTDVGTGTTALVLNRPERRVAGPGAPSRGVLPLLGVARGDAWPDHLEGLEGMASFSLVLAGPDALTCWTFDGERLARQDLEAGTHMVTSGGAEDGKAERHLSAFRATDSLAAWRGLVEARPPADDPAALVVRLERDGRVYATVFGQLIDADPGSLTLACSREPWVADSWQTRRWS
jgi:hypothetical protein